MPVSKTSRTAKLALIGDGPVALMTFAELVEKSQAPLDVTIIGENPKEKFGYGAISDTTLNGAFANVLAKKMSIDPAKSGEGRFVEYLKSLGLDKPSWQEASRSCDAKKLSAAGLGTQQDWEEMKDWITRFNAQGSKLPDQYIPRSLLHGMIKEFVAETENKAAQKGITLTYIEGKATDIIEDRAGVKIAIDSHPAIIRDTAAITIGLPLSPLPGEHSILDKSLVAKNVHHPQPGNVLFDKTSSKKDIIVVGSGHTSVDAVMALEKTGFFKDKSHHATVISPSGKFPYPHELTPSQAYDGGFLKNASAPQRLKDAATAKDLLDAILLSALHAVGATSYDDHGVTRFSAPAHSKVESKAIARLIVEGENALQTSTPEERAQLTKLFLPEAQKDASRFSWQQVMDHFRPQLPDKWQQFSTNEKQVWVESYSKVYGDFRNRAPAQVSETLDALTASGQVSMLQAKVETVSENAGKAVVRTDAGKLISADEVLNAIGWGNPERDSPLLSKLRSHGAITIDPVEGVTSHIPGIIMLGQNDGNPRVISATGWTELRAEANKGAEQLLEQLHTAQGWLKTVTIGAGENRARS